MSAATAVVVPAAPALLPGVGGASDPLGELRRTAAAAVAETLEATDVSRCVVVGAGPGIRRWPVDAPSGAARFVTGQVPDGALPTAVEIGRLLGPAEGGELVLQSVAADEAPESCLELGRFLAEDRRTMLLVVADGPATLTEKAPGHLHPEAAPVARRVADALSVGDPAALAALDAQTCERLWMRGRPALQVLAGAFEGGSPRARVLLDDAPFGVQYLVARWTAAG